MMRWEYPTKDNFGKERVIKKFALFPISINGQRRWLENVYILEEVQDDGYYYTSYRKRRYYPVYKWSRKHFVSKYEYELYRNELEQD